MKRSSIRIFIVDNRSIIRAGMRGMLKASDIRVLGEAATPPETLRLLRGRTPTLVLLGHLAEGGDGLGLARQIKHKWPKVAVILVTGTESPTYLSRALSLGCSGYLRDWVGRQELLKAVRAVARGESIVEPALFPKLLGELGLEDPQPEGEPAAQLTVTERELLRLITEGHTNRQIAHRLGYSMGTVKDYVQRIIQKLHVSDRTQAAVKATRFGLID
jgi:two-component system, NarL family, response regulator DevR